MVQFQTNQIPPSITSLEQLAVWAIQTLANLDPDLTSVEALDSSGTPVKARCAQAAIYQITAVSPSVPRFVGRISVALSPRYQAANSSVWGSAIPFDNTNSIPTGFTGAGT